MAATLSPPPPPPEPEFGSELADAEGVAERGEYYVRIWGYRHTSHCGGRRVNQASISIPSTILTLHQPCGGQLVVLPNVSQYKRGTSGDVEGPCGCHIAGCELIQSSPSDIGRVWETHSKQWEDPN